ncbi:MAG: hypothetical protein M3Z30_05850 [Gemmatimonadota bacterium]|nr:hypothetical protein [Gemmatimonadota bacterium]
MTPLSALWLPILVSAVFVFVASSIIHMALPWHKSDYQAVPKESEVTHALRPFGIPPGDYMLPRPAQRGDFKSPEYAERVKLGPNIVMTVLPNGQWQMGSTMAKWFVYCFVVSFLAAAVATSALDGRLEPHAAFHFAAITAFIGYSLALWQMAIWYGRSLATTIKGTIDGVVYGLITGATFMWLWPR